MQFSNPPVLRQLDEITRINNRQYSMVYNLTARTITATTPAGRRKVTTVDVLGRVTRVQVGSLAPLEFIYDASSRVRETRWGPRRSTITYDAAGRPEVLTDALMRGVTFAYDAVDRVTAQTLPDARTIGFGYDANGNATSLTPPGRPSHSFTFTPVDRTASYVPPVVSGTGPTQYQFNHARELTEVQRPDGHTTRFTYGTTGRLDAISFSRGTLTFGYDAAGRLSALGDPGGVVLSSAYDGPLTLSDTWSGSMAGSVSRTFTAEFDTATESVNGADTIAFGYDADRLLTSVGALSVARHAEHGLVTGMTLGSTNETHEYNEFGELRHQMATAGGSQVFDVQITRDARGVITARTEVVDGITRLFQYGYDQAGRLERVTRDGQELVLYSYDANGNRLSAQGAAGTVIGTYDDQDRLLNYGAASYTYAANGELATRTVGGQTTTYSYDTLGNLMQVAKPNGHVITYTVDGRGRRVAKAINGVRVKGWLYADQLQPVAELDGSGNLVSRFVYGTRANVPDYMIRGGATYRIVADHLGSPRVIVDTATGLVVQRMDFDAFGEVIQDSNAGWQPFGFAGGLYRP